MIDRWLAYVSSVAAGMLVLSCATMPVCDQPKQKLSSYFTGAQGNGWFQDAIVQTSYHLASIAPDEIMDDVAGDYFADRLTMSETTCSGEKRLQALLARSRFVKISGHGHYKQTPTRVFVLDCVCTAEPIMDTPELRTRMEPLFP